MTIPIPTYVIRQRRYGYAVNDGRWCAERVAPISWTAWGTPQRHGASRFLGVFDTREEAEAAAVADLIAWAGEDHTARPVR